MTNPIYDLGIGCQTCGNPIDVCSCSSATTPLVRQMFRGDDFIFTVQVQQSIVPGAPAQPIDITGWTMTATLKKSLVDPDNQAVSQVTLTTSVPTGGGITFTQPKIGIAQIIFPRLATAGFPDGPVRCVYDVQAKDLLGHIFTVEAAVIQVNPDVTRSIT